MVFFETLAKCWRPFDGHHYDLARQISSYFVNFIKTGNPNGNDYNENKLPEWKPYCDADRYEMNFTKDGAAGGSTETERMRFLLDNARIIKKQAEKILIDFPLPVGVIS